MQELRFDGRCVIVTGAGRGLGRSHAELFAARGASVVVNDLGVQRTGGSASSAPADEAVAAIREAGGVAEPNVSDVSTEAGARELVEQAVAAFGRVDVVVCNAGIHDRAPFEETSVEYLTRMLQVHVFGTFNVVQAAWPHLKERGDGRVVTTTSASGILGQLQSTGYGTAKAAIVGLTRSLALEGQEHGIMVNCICPTAFTRMAAEGLSEQHELQELMAATVPSSKVSPTVAAMAHERCTFTGEILEGMGGRVSRLYVGRTEGIEMDEPSPEIVFDNIDRIMSTDASSVPSLGSVNDALNWMRSKAAARQ